jgi:MFS family permease
MMEVRATLAAFAFRQGAGGSLLQPLAYRTGVRQKPEEKETWAMTSYTYALVLILGGALFGLGLGFIAAAGNHSNYKFAFKEGMVLAVAGVVVVLLALALLRPWWTPLAWTGGLSVVNNAL